MKITGIILVLLGVLWILQGFGIVGGSFMTGQSQWLYIGVVTASSVRPCLPGLHGGRQHCEQPSDHNPRAGGGRPPHAPARLGGGGRQDGTAAGGLVLHPRGCHQRASPSWPRCGEPRLHRRHFFVHRVSCLLPDGQREFMGVGFGSDCGADPARRPRRAV